MTREMDGAPAGSRITALDPHSAMRVTSIDQAEIPAVAAFLHTAVDARLSVAQWRALFAYDWPGVKPDHGFVVAVGGETTRRQARA